MNLRFWGGWFLAIACVCIFLTMGCENGALGVKSAVVLGRVVNKDNFSMGVANATIRMISKEQFGSGEIQQGNNFLATTSDAEGYFVFEKVTPDNVVFEITAPGYKKILYPSTKEEQEDDGSTSESSDIESVSIRSGETVDLKNIAMQKVSVTLPEAINVKLEFVTPNKTPISDNEYFTVSFDGVAYTKKAKAWRESGVDGILGASEINLNIRNEAEPVLYEPTSTTISGTSDVYQIIEVKPVSYTITFQFLHLPAYIVDSSDNVVMSVVVEDVSTIPYMQIFEQKVNVLTQLATFEIPAVKNPQQLRIRMNGYEDEVIDLSGDLDEGTKGSYRIDVDFDLADGHKGEDPVTCAELNGVIGMKDNVKKSDIEFNMIGLVANDKANVTINLPHESVVWSQSYVTSDSKTIGLANSEGSIKATFKNAPVGFDLTYTISVFPDNPASSSYIISSGEKAISIPVPSVDDTVAKTIDLDISKLDSTSSGY